MAKFLRSENPDETRRRVHIQISEDDSPGLLKFLRLVPYGFEAPFIRAVLMEWFRSHDAAGSLDAALGAFVTEKRSSGEHGLPAQSLSIGSSELTRKASSFVTSFPGTGIPAHTESAIAPTRSVQPNDAASSAIQAQHNVVIEAQGRDINSSNANEQEIDPKMFEDMDLLLK